MRGGRYRQGPGRLFPVGVTGDHDARQLRRPARGRCQRQITATYPTTATAMLAVRRLCEIVDRTAREARGLRNGHRHATIVACMVAMYLSKDGAYVPDMRAGTRALAGAGGSLTRLLLPLLRMWRAAYLKRAAAGARAAPARGAVRSELPPGSQLPAAAQTFVIWKSPFTHLERCRRRYGSRFTINMTSHPPLVFLSEPDDIKAMLAAPADVLHPGEGADTIEPLVGEQSFMLLDEDEHLNGRKVILPAFHAKLVADHAELVADRRAARGRLVAAGRSLRATSASARVDAGDRPADDLRRCCEPHRSLSLCAARSPARNAGGHRQRGLPGAALAPRSRASDLDALPAHARGGRSADLRDHRGSSVVRGRAALRTCSTGSWRLATRRLADVHRGRCATT